MERPTCAQDAVSIIREVLLPFNANLGFHLNLILTCSRVKETWPRGIVLNYSGGKADGLPR
jgi:hypothetical protein